MNLWTYSKKWVRSSLFKFFPILKTFKSNPKTLNSIHSNCRNHFLPLFFAQRSNKISIASHHTNNILYLPQYTSIHLLPMNSLFRNFLSFLIQTSCYLFMHFQSCKHFHLFVRSNIKSRIVSMFGMKWRIPTRNFWELFIVMVFKQSFGGVSC